MLTGLLLILPVAAPAGKPGPADGAPALVRRFVAKMFPGRSPGVEDVTPADLARRFKISLFRIDRTVVLIEGKRLHPLYQLRGARQSSRHTFHYLVEDLDGDKKHELYFMWNRRRGEMRMGSCYSFRRRYRCVQLNGPGSGMRFYRDDAGRMITVVTTLFPMPRGKISQTGTLRLIPTRAGKTYKIKWTSPVDLRGHKRGPTQAIRTALIKPFR